MPEAFRVFDPYPPQPQEPTLKGREGFLGQGHGNYHYAPEERSEEKTKS